LIIYIHIVNNAAKKIFCLFFKQNLQNYITNRYFSLNWGSMGNIKEYIAKHTTEQKGINKIV